MGRRSMRPVILTKKAKCLECGRKRDWYRPAVRDPDGTVRWACRQCWKRCDYDDFYYPKA